VVTAPLTAETIPHCADHTPEWLNDAMRFFIAQYERFRKGEPLTNVVDKKLGYPNISSTNWDDR